MPPSELNNRMLDEIQKMQHPSIMHKAKKGKTKGNRKMKPPISAKLNQNRRFNTPGVQQNETRGNNSGLSHTRYSIQPSTLSRQRSSCAGIGTANSIAEPYYAETVPTKRLTNSRPTSKNAKRKIMKTNSNLSRDSNNFKTVSTKMTQSKSSWTLQSRTNKDTSKSRRRLSSTNQSLAMQQ